MKSRSRPWRAHDMPFALRTTELILWAWPANTRKHSPSLHRLGLAAVEIDGSNPAWFNKFWNAVAAKFTGPRPLTIRLQIRNRIRVADVIRIVGPDLPFCGCNSSGVREKVGCVRAKRFRKTWFSFRWRDSPYALINWTQISWVFRSQVLQAAIIMGF